MRSFTRVSASCGTSGTRRSCSKSRRAWGWTTGDSTAALDAGGGEAALREAAEEARRRRIVAVPAFVFEGVTIGAHPPEVLGQAVERAAAAG